MRGRHGTGLLLLLASGCSLSCGAAAPQTKDEAIVSAPVAKLANQPAGSIGFYNNGCQDGAVALPERGPGYVLVRKSRGRFFGHPDTVAFVRDTLTQHAATAYGQPTPGGLALGIGDVSAQYGGKVSHHGSHQHGLDVDVVFALFPQDKSSEELEKMTWPSFVDWNNKRLLESWDPRTVQFLRLVAEDPRVDRIFVNPVIKKSLCETETGDRGWLRKVRSEWGHDDHMHVRMVCPAGNMHCRPQKALQGDGCDEASFAAYFSPPPPKQPPAPRPPPPPPPSACIALWDRVRNATNQH